VRYRTLGRTGVQVSTLGLGTNQFGRVVDEAGAKAIIDRAQELGLNFIDSAESYGPDGKSEMLLGKALAGRRDAFVLATKTGAGSDPGRQTRKGILQRLDASLGRLQTNYIDLYYLHFPDASTPLEESLRALEDATRAGKIRYAALSNHPAWQVAEAVGLADRRGWQPIAATQMEYSLVERAVERETLPACAHLGVSLVPFFPLAGGFLTGKYQKDVAPPPNTRFGRAQQRPRYLTDDNFAKLERWKAFASERGHEMHELAIAWLLAHPVVCSVIAGATAPDQLTANAKATEWSLSAEDLAAIP
jgi:aryl-alcohol dehydrogenase-like predicted oxidoreductase